MGRDGHTGEETWGILAKDGSKFLAFFPHPVFVIAEDNDLRLCAKRAEILILFDCKDTHGGDCTRHTFLAEGMIFTKRNQYVGVELLNTAFLFKEAFQPNLFVRVSVSQCFEDQRWAVTMEVDGTDEGSNGIECGWSRG